jgi:hypothetical protein
MTFTSVNMRNLPVLNQKVSNRDDNTYITPKYYRQNCLEEEGEVYSDNVTSQEGKG